MFPAILGLAANARAGRETAILKRKEQVLGQDRVKLRREGEM
jgi:hypothetical protein